MLRFREYFEVKGIYENKLYPDTIQVLETLKKAGKTLAVATSKPEVSAEIVLKHFGIRQYFDGVFGASLDESKVHKADIIQEALDAFPGQSAIMIGDREHDILGAKAHGLPSIGVLSGFGSRQELEDAGADIIVNSLADTLPCLLDEKS